MIAVRDNDLVARPKKGPVRPSAPLLACGCHLRALARLLIHHRFRVHWKCWPALAVALLGSAVQTSLRPLQTLCFGRRVARTRLREAPIFIIGHWRTGTTLLHYLLTLDERHVGPNSYECFAPNHFLLTERWMMKRLRKMQPSRRPMDNVLVGPESPQEDEFALLMLGQPSPYLGRMSFPNEPPLDSNYFTLENLSAEARAAWQQTLLRFLQQLTFLHRKRIVLKSPLHSGRIKYLLELFPEARFVHIVRDPYVVYASTVHMRRASIATYAWQEPTFAGLEEEVFRTGLTLYQQLEEGRKLVPPGHFHELRYEDLVRDPVEELHLLYERLELTGFESFLPRLEAYLADVAGYKTNRYEISTELRDEITRRWWPIIERYGYAPAPEYAYARS